MLIKFMAFILIVAFAGLFFVDGPNGKPVLVLEDMMPSTPDVAVVMPEAPTKVYKWQDENGVWQFSNHASDEGENVEVLELDGKINIMPAVTIPAPASVSSAKSSVDASAFKALPSGLTSVSPDKISEMMETINGLQETVDQRKKALDAATGHP